MPSRRQFLQLAGAGAAVALAEQRGFSEKADEPSPKKSPKYDFHLGLASYSTRMLSLDETLKIAARLELKYLCLKSCHLPLEGAPEQIVQAAEKVKAAGIDLYGCGVVKMSDAADVERAFDYAEAAGMKVIVAAPAYDVLPLVNEKIKQYDICAAIHNHGPGDKLYPTPAAAYEKIKQFDPRFGLCIDIGHTIRGGVDPARAAERFADRLLDIHMKDVDQAAAAGRTIEAGRGVIDIPEFLRALVKIGYRRVVSFEFEKDPRDLLPGLAESVGYVRGALAAI
ncbi:MAG: sugar phosphate isomerase/epimerase [Pirellulales bacterium]|nr:sugar phosphate isomerase/epimerase [Pirellulales bacterium]